MKTEILEKILWTALAVIIGMIIGYGIKAGMQEEVDCLDCKWKYQDYIDYWIEKETQYRCLDTLDCIGNRSLKGCWENKCNSCCNNVCTLMACGWEGKAG